ncbi:Uma2 family endonuclease [Gloeobacter morelensis]|uniref:Uma2 family endonuclease n=1 Tax=Gloeobacter morelensis MG652769 TaxID=2781736 RepID=A0ABY3PH89_9CYAN|nr:Uma2 family endonuclease [Gloeobacter morelensis]UFP93037.1 Uma2 family endonuclease [Gloeobacter morelensis MG652769]
MTFMQPAYPLPPKQTLPTMYDLPSEDPEEPGLPDEFHSWQPQLLSQTFVPAGYPPERIFSASDLNLYYDPLNPRYHKRPDWFAVVGVPRLVDEGRLSYVFWQEGRAPVVIVELLSPSTQEEDQGETLRGREPPSKWEVYESILRVPYYVLFDRNGDVLRTFQLQGTAYRELSELRLWIDELQIGLGLWQGEFAGVERTWLRWYDGEGEWMPTEAERERQLAERFAAQERTRAEQAEQRAEQAERLADQERQRAEQAEQRAAALTERLKAMGVDPDDL